METYEVEYATADHVKIKGIVDSPDGPYRGCIVLCHGITSDKNENGKFINLSKRLMDAGFVILRFDFRGHGESSLKPEEMTISGELLDLEASISYIMKKQVAHSAIGLLAASFGAGAAILFTLNYKEIIRTLVLWNPVLDYQQTFIRSRLPWGRSIFSSQGYQELNEKGFITIPGKDFRIGKRLIAEFSHYKPYEELSKVKCPVLTIHGSHDKKAPYWVSNMYGKPNDRSEFISVDSDHGFGNRKDYVIQKTVEWFERLLI